MLYITCNKIVNEVQFNIHNFSIFLVNHEISIKFLRFFTLSDNSKTITASSDNKEIIDQLLQFGHKHEDIIIAIDMLNGKECDINVIIDIIESKQEKQLLIEASAEDESKTMSEYDEIIAIEIPKNTTTQIQFATNVNFRYKIKQSNGKIIHKPKHYVTAKHVPHFQLPGESKIILIGNISI